MKKYILILIIFFSTVFLNAQDSKIVKFGFGYSAILNYLPVVSLNEDIVSFKLTHSFNIFFIHQLKNSDKVISGINYQYLFGESEVKNYTIYDCSNNLINFTKSYKKRINVIQINLAYRFRPFNKKGTFYSELFVQPGFAFKSSSSIYSPELGCMGYLNKTEKFSDISFTGGVGLFHRLFSNKSISLNFNYGLAYQFIDLSIKQINALAGVELNF